MRIQFIYLFSAPDWVSELRRLSDAIDDLSLLDEDDQTDDKHDLSLLKLKTIFDESWGDASLQLLCLVLHLSSTLPELIWSFRNRTQDPTSSGSKKIGQERS